MQNVLTIFDSYILSENKNFEYHIHNFLCKIIHFQNASSQELNDSNEYKMNRIGRNMIYIRNVENLPLNHSIIESLDIRIVTFGDTLYNM